MGVKYFARYKDVEGVIKEIRFSKDDFSGTPTEWFCTNGAVDFNAGASDNFFPDQPIIASQARISLFLNEHYDLSEFAVNRRTFFVEIVNTNTNQTKWSGWVEPWDAARAYKKAPWEMNLTASCGLAHLSRKKYTSSNSDFRKTGLEIIQECLQIIGSSLNVVVSTHMKENSFPGDAVLGLNSYEQDITRFFDSNGEAMYCNVIVNDILNHYNAEIIQDNNRWVIRGIVDHATGLATSQHEIGGNPSAGALPGTYEVNSLQSFTEDGGQVRILAPINKYRTEVDLGAQRPFFDNGNMLIWNENGLVGWDFTHMPKGNPGWERYEIGGETTRGILKINGKAPQPYRKRKKVKLFKKLTNQAINIAIAGTGAVGALFNKPVLKGQWEEIEPSEWIESPGGTISKADASVTISFDYETEFFSSDILISIRIPVNTPNGVKNFWVDPNSEPALAGADKSARSLDDKFHLIRIPPVDRGKLVDKGDINVGSNPNYPAANAVGWTWTVTGVPSGEFRKIGGANGVIVENGDAIIARVANTGGSQEVTGNNWEVISVRNNIKRGNYAIKVSLNTTFITKPGDPFPADKIYVRFYKMADDEGLRGDWYKIYNLNGQLEGFVPSEDSAQYATTLERGGVTDEEAATIQLISGDYNPYYVGGWTKPGTNDPTKSWSRRPTFPEGISIYRAMMKDRLSMTTRSVNVIEGNIRLMPGAPELSYLHTLVFGDQGGRRFRIVRFRYNEVKRTANVKAIEVRYEEIPNSELRQDSYIPGKRQLNTVPGEGDGIYPSKEDSTNGRLNAEDLPLSAEEIIEAIGSTGRAAALFEDITPLTYVAGVESEDSVDLKDFISEAFLEDEEEFEPEDRFDITTLILKLVSKPAWITEIDDENLVITATALAPKSGSFNVDYYGYDPEDTEFEDPILIRIPVLVEENEDYVETWPPEFDPFPVLSFVLNKETVTGFNFRDYITSGHKNLLYRFFSVPDWILERSVVNDDFSITGEPAVIEKRRISVEIWDGIEEHRPYIDEITLQVIEATEITGELMDIASGDAKVGDLPGAFEVLEQWDTPIAVKGLHDRVTIKVTGGGDLGTELDVTENFPLSEPVEEGIYRPFNTIGGTTAGVGQYVIEVTAYLGENTTVQLFDLTLYDEEYLAKMRKYLTKEFDHVGEIMPDGGTSFVYPGAVNARAEIHDIDFDEIYISLEKDGEVIGEQHLTNINPAITWWFYALEEDTELEPGVYTFPVRLLKDGVDVFKRTDKFTIESKEAEPKPLLSLATFAPGTTNATIIAENIPLKGAEYDLVPWTLIFNGFGPDIKCATGEWELQFLRGGSFAEVDLEQYTNYPQKFEYISGKSLIFGNKSSLKIGDIHQAPSRVLARFIGRDSSGNIVGIAQADFSFRVPLDPEDYSGLRFLTIDRANAGEMTLLDPNVPISGRQYYMPPAGFWWTVSARSFGGVEFDQVKVYLSRVVGSVEQPAWVLGEDYIVLHNVGSVVTELTDDDKAYIFGWDTDGDGIRIVYRVGDNVPMPLDGEDGLGFWKVTMVALLESVEVSTLSATIELIEDVEPPIKDCCACDCDGEGSGELEFPFTTPAEEWIVTHNLNRRPDPNILVGGMKVFSDVQYIDNDVLKIIHTKPVTGLVIITN